MLHFQPLVCACGFLWAAELIPSSCAGLCTQLCLFSSPVLSLDDLRMFLGPVEDAQRGGWKGAEAQPAHCKATEVSGAELQGGQQGRSRFECCSWWECPSGPCCLFLGDLPRLTAAAVCGGACPALLNLSPRGVSKVPSATLAFSSGGLSKWWRGASPGLSLLGLLAKAGSSCLAWVKRVLSASGSNYSSAEVRSK